MKLNQLSNVWGWQNQTNELKDHHILHRAEDSCGENKLLSDTFQLK